MAPTPNSALWRRILSVCRIQPTFWPCCPRPCGGGRLPASGRSYAGRQSLPARLGPARCAPRRKTAGRHVISAPALAPPAAGVIALAAAYVSARGVSATRCSCPNGPGRLCGPWEMRGCLPPHWVICWPTRCSRRRAARNIPCVRRGAGKRCFFTVADNGPGCAPSAGTAAHLAWLHGAMPAPTAAACWQAAGAPGGGACFSLCLPLCPPGAAPSVPDYMGRPLQSAVRAACACVRSAVVTVRPPECSVPAREAVSFVRPPHVLFRPRPALLLCFVVLFTPACPPSASVHPLAGQAFPSTPPAIPQPQSRPYEELHTACCSAPE